MELVNKADFKLDVAKGVIEMVLGHDGSVKAVVVVPLSYLVDEIEKLVPGDQSGLAQTLKNLFGLIP